MAHNGGITQINIQSVNSYPFINLMKTGSGEIKYAQNPLQGNPVDPALRDANGYPKSIQAGGWNTQIFVPATRDRPGNYIITWDGNGTIQSLSTAVTYTISSVVSGATTTVNIDPSTPISPNTSTTNQLLSGQCVQLANASGGSWGTISGRTYKILSMTGNQLVIDLDSRALGSFSAGQIKNTLTNKTTAGVACAGRYVYTPNGSSVSIHLPFSQFVGVSSMDANPDYIRNMAFYHADDEASYLAGGVFGVKWLAKLAELNPGVIRDLDWIGINLNKVSFWSERLPTTYWSYCSNQWLPSAIAPGGTATTYDGTSKFTLAWPGFVLTDKVKVHVQWSGSPSTSATLNVGGTGDINIIDYQFNTLGSTSLPVNNKFSTLVYVQALNAWVLNEPNGPNSTSRYQTGMVNGSPPELFLSLCSTIGAHPWFCVPIMDDTQDYINGLAAYVRDNGPSWMKARYEGGNELFNTGNGFSAGPYMVATQLAYSGGWNTTTGLPGGGAFGAGTVYNISAIATGAQTDLTLGSSFTGSAGGYMILGGTFTGVSGLSANQLIYIKAINVGGNAAKVTICDRNGANIATSGSYSGSGTIKPSPSEFHQPHGKYLSKMGAAVSAVYSGDTSRYDTVCSLQLATGSGPSSNDAKLGAYGYVISGGVAATGYVTSICTSCYLQSSEYNTSTETSTRWNAWAPRQFTGYISGGTTLTVSSGTAPNVGDEISSTNVNYGTLVTGGSNPTFTINVTHSDVGSSGSPVNFYAGDVATRRMQEAAYIASIGPGTGQENLTKAATYWLALANWADGFGVKKMYAYEGGPDPFFRNNSVDQFRISTNINAEWAQWICITAKTWAYGQYPPSSNQYPAGFSATFPSQYFFAGTKPAATAWMMLADVYATPDPGSFTGWKLLNTGKQRFKVVAS